jgi:hypothetical protein
MAKAAAAAAAAGDAEQIIQVDSASLNRRIGGALIIPSIPSFMGNLLFRLSKRPGIILRSFLGIRSTKVSWTDYMLPPWRGLHSRVGVLPVNDRWEDLNLYQKAMRGFQAFIILSRVDRGRWWSLILCGALTFFFLGGWVYFWIDDGIT